MKKLLFCSILLLLFACGNSDKSIFPEDYEYDIPIIEDKIEWESIGSGPHYMCSQRLRVPGGWIIRSSTNNYDGGIHQIFIADSLHEWRIK